MTRWLIRQLHLWVGLALCVPLVLLGLTGSILVFEDELGAGPAIAGMGEAKSVGAIIAAACAAAPSGFAPLSYAAPTTPNGLAMVRLAPPRRNGGGAPAAGPGADAFRVAVDPVTLATYPDLPDGFLRQLASLHTNLLMKGREGRQLVGWLGVVMLVMGVSGLVNWWPRAGQWRRAFSVRLGARGYLLNREMHGMAGIWGLLVFLVVSFGGVEMAFPETVRGITSLVLPARDLRADAAAIKIQPARGVEPMTIDDAVTLARGTMPGADLRFVFFPARPDQPVRIALLRPGQERREPPVQVFIDPFARRIIETLDPRKYSAGEALLAWQHPLHAGQGAGVVWKILVFLVGFLPLGFAVTGVTMWWLKRQAPAAGDMEPAIDPLYTAREAGE